MAQGTQPTDGQGTRVPPGTQTAPDASAGEVLDATADLSTETAETESIQTESDRYKGLKAGMDLTVTGGTYEIDAQDDAVHSLSLIHI